MAETAPGGVTRVASVVTGKLGRLRIMLALLLVLPVVAIPPAAMAQETPALAGTNIINSEGTAGATLVVDGEHPLSSDSLRIEPLGATTFAMAAIGRAGEWWFDGVRYSPIQFTDFYLETIEGYARPCCDIPSESALYPGVLEVYIVSDGPVTVTLTVPGLIGTTTVNASRSIDAHFERIPSKCEGHLCGKLGYGGYAWTAQPGTFAASIAYSYVPPYAYPAPGVRLGESGWVPAAACIYTASPDPADHPHGCDGPEGYGTVFTAQSLALGSGLGRFGSLKATFTYEAIGPTYLGWTAGNHSTLSGDGRFGGIGVVIAPGIP